MKNKEISRYDNGVVQSDSAVVWANSAKQGIRILLCEVIVFVSFVLVPHGKHEGAKN